MKQHSHKIFLLFLVFLLSLMESHAWATFPQIPKAIETRFYQGSPQDIEAFIEERRKQADQLISEGNRSHSLAADRLLQDFNRGQIAPKCVFPTDYALKPEKRLSAVRGGK